MKRILIIRSSPRRRRPSFQRGYQTLAFYTYILASKRNGTLYTGSTDNLINRVWQHKQKLRPGFTADYNVDQLVWYEAHEPAAALLGESVRSRNGTGHGSFG